MRRVKSMGTFAKITVSLATEAGKSIALLYHEDPDRDKLRAASKRGSRAGRRLRRRGAGKVSQVRVELVADAAEKREAIVRWGDEGGGIVKAVMEGLGRRRRKPDRTRGRRRIQ